MISTKKKVSDLPWRLLLIEAFLVVASVFLALALEDWQQSRAENKVAERALQGFIDEMQINCRKITNVKAYHDGILSGERNPQGVQIGLLRNDAWDVVKTTGGAPHLDYEILAKMGEISALQGDHRAVVQAYIQALFGLALQFKEDQEWHLAGERGVINELVGIQSDLLESYQSLLHLVEREYQSSIDTRRVCSSI